MLSPHALLQSRHSPTCHVASGMARWSLYAGGETVMVSDLSRGGKFRRAVSFDKALIKPAFAPTGVLLEAPDQISIRKIVAGSDKARQSPEATTTAFNANAFSETLLVCKRRVPL
jgi:hypothetical protein